MIVLALDGAQYQLDGGRWRGPAGATLAMLTGSRELWQAAGGTGPGELPTAHDRDRAWSRWVLRHIGGTLVHEDPPPPAPPAPFGVVY